MPDIRGDYHWSGKTCDPPLIWSLCVCTFSVAISLVSPPLLVCVLGCFPPPFVEIIRRMLRAQPYHCIYQIYQLKNAGISASSSGRSSGSVGTSVNPNRVLRANGCSSSLIPCHCFLYAPWLRLHLVLSVNLLQAVCHMLAISQIRILLLHHSSDRVVG